MQFFKGDEQEQRFAAVGEAITTQLSAQRSDFTTGAYTAFPLGELLYDTGRAPLANAIPREIFREAFYTIFESFLSAGTFESYLTVFRNIFGEAVEVTFTVPAPGKLEIDIVAAGIELYDIVARQIVGDELVIYEIIDDEGDNIAAQAVKGFESQYELEQMLFEMVPAGIYTQISLTVGS